MGGNEWSGRRSKAISKEGSTHLHLQSSLPTGSKTSAQTKGCQLKPNQNILPRPAPLLLPLHSSGFHPGKITSQELPFNLPPSHKEGKQKEAATMIAYSYAAGAIKESPETEVERRCLPWTESAGTAGRAAEQCISNSKASE